MSDAVTIYHNPHCPSSVHAVRIAEELGVAAEVIVYQKTPPDRETLLWIAEHLEDPACDLVRKDSLFKKLGLDAGDYVTPEAVADLLASRKMLLQRPVVIRGETAIIGRPKERISHLLSQ
jgi:arsenate reductase (glutaredoxin)